MIAALLLVLLLLWSLGFVFVWRVPLPRREDGDDQAVTGPGVSVIVPARNEERSLPLLLACLSSQSLTPGEIIVVDDHSEDRTALLAREAGAIVIPAPPLPDDWLGKPWACWHGAQAATGDTLVFVDADTTLEPGGLERILASHRRTGGLMSVWPYHRMVRLYERLSALFNVVILASMRCFTIWGRRLPPLGAFGPCVVCSRVDYFASGGHEQTRSAILEDVALGQAFQRAGYQVHNYGGRGSISFRMYPAGVGALFSGFAKNLGSGARSASPPVLLPAIGWITGAVVVTASLAYGLAAGLAALCPLPGAAPAPAACLLPWAGLLPWACLYVLYALQIHWMLRRLGNYGLLTALVFPLPLVFFVAVFLVSLLRTFVFRRVRWKGRSIPAR